MDQLVEVTAIVRTVMLERLVHVLRDAGVPRLAITSIHAIGRGADPATARIELQAGVASSDKSQVQFVCGEDRHAMYVELICGATATGQHGDGIVYVRPVLSVTKIRTGVVGRAALD